MAKKKARRSITRKKRKKSRSIIQKRKKIHRIYIHEEGMIGLIWFSKQDINNNISKYRYGVYLLTAENDDGEIVVVYVGRGNIRDRLTEHLSDRTKRKAQHFCVKYLPDDDEEGFREECRLYHLYGKRDCLLNKNHPPVPADSPPWYPRCSVLGCHGEP